MKIFYWMTLVASPKFGIACRTFELIPKQTKNSERCSLFLVVMLLLLLSACQPQSQNPQQITYSGPIMGTEYRISLIEQRELDFDLLEQQVIAAMDDVNQSMSTYLASSELSQFNAVKANTPVVLSDKLAEVIGEALHISEISDGAFDVTVGQVVNLWGFGPDGQISEFPSAERLAELSNSVGYQKLSFDGRALSKLVDGVNIDLSSIAKGYAVDKVAELLNSAGVSRYLINIGGELRASGRSISDEAWRVGIEKPHVLGGVQRVARLYDQAIATSGDYRNYHLIDGQQFSHMIDPTTLKPKFHKLALVSVISDRASTADALATAILVMGEEQGMEFALREGLSVYMLVRASSKDEYRVVMTPSFRQNLQ